MRRIVKVISALMVAALALGGAIVMAQPERQYERMYEVATPELLSKGVAWLNREGGADSALVCFSLAASRYNKSMSRQDKELMVKANRGKWLVYFSYLYDYPKAYESLQKAIDISEEAGVNKAKTHLSMGGMLHVIADQNGSADMYSKAMEDYSAAIREASAADDIIMDFAFVNMIVLSRSRHSTAVLDKAWERYRKLGG